MNAFSRIIRTATLAAVISSGFSAYARAEERTAGTMPVSSAPESGNDPAEEKTEDKTAGIAEEKEDKSETVEQSAETVEPDAKNEDNAAPETPAPAPAPIPDGIRLTKAELEELESYGLLTDISDGGLGIDVWQGSEKDFLLHVLAEMPTASGYRTTQNLLRRALLTRSDIALMSSGGRGEPGNDFLTARIEKLTEMGYFSDAVKLYTENPGKPYHERLARAGITAMMLGGEMSLACLETKTLIDGYKDVPFWQQAAEICTYHMARLAGEKNSDAAAGDSAPGKILRQVAANAAFRYTVREAADFESLEFLEKALLVHEKRIDYSHLKESAYTGFSPLSLALFLRDENLPDARKMELMAYSAARGLTDSESLTAFYKSIPFPQLKKSDAAGGAENVEGWKKLPYLYQAAEESNGDRRRGLVTNALILNNKYGIYALLPFAAFLDDLDPGSLPPESIRAALKLFALAGQAAPQPFLDQWAAVRTKNTRDIFTDLAYRIATNTSLETADNADSTSDFPESDGGAGLQILNMLKEKLDKTKKLHKYTPNDAYEKNLDLTIGVGYVMPSVSLIDNLEKAEEDRRLGEVILLSSIALNGVPPAKMYAGLLQKVMYGLETVGLSKEARELAMEVVLGIENEKEN